MKPARYRSAILGDEPVTIVVTMVDSWRERPSTYALPEVPEVVFLRQSTSIGFLGQREGGFRLKRKWEVGKTGKGHAGTSGEEQVDRRSIAPLANSSYRN